MSARAITAALCLAAGLCSAADRPVRIVFGGVQAQDAKARGEAQALSPLVAAEVARTGRVVVAPTELVEIDARTLEGCPSTACQALGAKLQADYLLVASVARLGKRLGFELRLVDPAAPAPVGERADVVGSEKELTTAALAAVQELLALVPAQRARPDDLKPPPPDEPRAELPVAVAPEASAEAPSRLPGILVASAGGAASIVGVVLVTTALGFNQAKADLTFDEAQAARSGAQARLIAGYALLGAGVASLGVGLWMALSPTPVAAAFVPAPGGGTFAVAGVF